MKPILELKDKKVLVVGMARSGCAAAGLLQRHGAHVTITDMKNADQLKSAMEQLAALKITIETGGHHPDSLKSAELIVLSPGVSLETPIMKEAKDLNVPVISELELGYLFCKSRIAAITGTNGKTTTVHLLHQMVKDAGVPGILAGNVGLPFSQVAEASPENGVAVLEVSSFQLETIQHFRPQVATILNITPDHLDRYLNMQNYIEAKARIVLNQKSTDILVLNGEDKYTPLLSNQAQSRLLTFSALRPPEIEGVWVERGRIFFRLFGLGQGEMMLADELLIPGPHNLENALAAIAMGLSLGLAPISMVQTLRKFRGVVHRLEPVRRVKGVWYVNDSKGTNVDAVIKALQSYTAPIVLILGGRDKNGNFRVLRDLLLQRARAVVVMGEAADVIAKQIEGTVQILHEQDLESAVRAASSIAGEGDVVLLSPGCASFDQFENFEHRGDTFKALVNRLAIEAGEADPPAQTH